MQVRPYPDGIGEPDFGIATQPRAHTQVRPYADGIGGPNYGIGAQAA
jgi:hypothetical protein